MLSKNDSKYIKSLQLKKFRIKEKAFAVEGEKNVLELIHSKFHIRRIYASNNFIQTFSAQINQRGTQIEIAKESEISNSSFLKTNTIAIAIAEIPEPKPSKIGDNHILAFDNIQDPGNLGTIIRTADWYGFKNIVCSLNSVDCYNPKVIAATMGSFSRVNVHYLDLEEFIKEQDIPVYGAVLSGKNIHTISFKEKGMLLFGNESKGISEDIAKLISDEVLIPGYGGAESLNVSIATAIFCDNLRRSQNN